MKSCSKTLLICWLTCSLTAGGCATVGARTRTSATSTIPQPEEPDELPTNPQPSQGWPAYYPPLLLGDISGTNEATGNAASFPRGYLFHRTDVEKVRVLKLHANRCDTDLADCERKVAEAAALPSFWSRTEGRVLMIAIGFVAGLGTTVGIVYAVGGRP